MKLDQPLKLSPNLFTPLSRTPWGGKEIARNFKRDFVENPDDTTIGESWEVSCDPAFPSEVLGFGLSLYDLIAQEPEKMLSPAYVKAHGPNCDILIKLINAAEPLSLQVHPTDDDENLKPGECGKPESWLVLHAEPGAGLYLGFSRSIEKAELEALLNADGDLKPLLQFVPVKAGDYFEINPGVVHAIGPGVTLLEPQRVRIGKAGKTYRFWDWSRKYNPDGTANPTSGQPRELHVKEGMRIIEPKKQFGVGYVASLRARAEHFELSENVRYQSYPSNANYQVHRLEVKSPALVQISARDGFLTFMCLGGEGTLGRNISVKKGEPGFIPYQALPLLVEATGSDTFDIALVAPAGVEIRIIEVNRKI